MATAPRSSNRSASARQGLLRSASLLATAQMANLVFPLVGLIYLTRQLGLETYGVVGLGVALVQVSSLVVDYGFGVSAPAELARVRQDPTKVAEATHPMMGARAVLAMTCACLILLFGQWHGETGDERTYFMFLAATVLGVALQPFWFFQGMERMGWIAVCTLFAKSLNLLLLVRLVSGPDDLAMVGLASAASSFVAGSLAIYGMRRLGYRMRWPSLPSIRSRLAYGRPFFTSRLASATYNAGGVIFLGLTAPGAQTAAYSIGQQAYQGLQAGSSALAMSAYPHMARTRDFKFLKRITMFMLGISVPLALVGTVVLFTAERSDWLPQYAVVLPVLVVVLWSFVAVSVSSIVGYPYFAARDRLDLANNTVIAGGVAFAVAMLIYAVIGVDEALAVALTLLAVETGILVARLTLIVKIEKGR